MYTLYVLYIVRFFHIMPNFRGVILKYLRMFLLIDLFDFLSYIFCLLTLNEKQKPFLLYQWCPILGNPLIRGSARKSFSALAEKNCFFVFKHLEFNAYCCYHCSKSTYEHRRIPIQLSVLYIPVWFVVT